jgi:peroxiredoxin
MEETVSMKKNPPISIGCEALDFTLDDQKGKSFRLSDFTGKNVLLSFHPLAWTSVCSKQMKSLEKHKKDFTKINTVAVGISVDSVPCKNAWAKHLGIVQTPLLSDFWPHGAVARLYCVFLEKEGVSGRANILIDEEQRIAFMKNYPLSQVPDIREILSIIQPGATMLKSKSHPRRQT